MPTAFFSLQAWHRNPITGWPTLLRHPIAQTTRRGTGILTRCPSSTALALDLGPTDPTRTNLASETLGLRRTRFSRVLRYSSQHSHFCALHRSLRSSFAAAQNAPLPPHLAMRPAASVRGLSPLYRRRRITRPVSYYALFKGWLLLSQPPGCPSNPTSFST